MTRGEASPLELNNSLTGKQEGVGEGKIQRRNKKEGL